jgi:hypothetical protein
VADESGAVLPGASVTLAGEGIGTRNTTSGSQGDFRFLNLDPGSYRVTVSLSGFATVTREVIVATGVNVDVGFGLKVATLEETITITAETPVVDNKRTGTSTTLSQDELARTPNARDPWAVLRTVPGVMVDRVNIAGSETGQQAQFTGKGSTQADTVWSLDGIVITDPAAAGASPAYYDFDAFQEISYATGGSDVRMATSGIGINFVTKRGTNAFHGSARYFIAHDKLQSGNLPSELLNDPRLQNPDGTFRDKADHIDQVTDYGAELGGPLVKDKLWFWGSYGKQDIRLVRLAGAADKTLLPTYNAKLSWQASPSDMVSFTYFQSGKEKFGRSTGFPGVEDDSHLRDQGPAYDSPLHGLFKGEWDHTFGPSLIMNAKYAFYDQGFTLAPRGGTDQDELQDLVNGVARGSFNDYRSTRPTHTLSLDSSYFAGRHELKVGFYYRTGTVNSSNTPSGNQIRAVLQPGGGLTGSEAFIQRASVLQYGGRYLSGYVADTFTKDRLTLNVGLRFDHQHVANKPSTAPANVAFPELLPDLVYDGSGPSISFNDFSPRLGFTWAFDQSRKTLLRASVARYNGQLSWGDVSSFNPMGNVARLTYHWDDANGDGFAQPNEVDFASGQLAPPRFATPSSANQLDPDYSATRDFEAIGGIEHELVPNLAVGVAYTFKHQTGAPWVPYLGLSRSDFTPRDPVTANGYTVTPQAADSASPEFNGGFLLQNRPDYNRRYNGVEFTLNKRLSAKWLGRVAFTYQSWTENFTGPGGIQNPNPTLYDTYGYLTAGAGSVAAEPLEDGGQYVAFGSGSGRSVWFNGRWQLSANALYQLPSGFEISGALFGRHGYPLLTNIVVDQGALLGTGYAPVLAADVEDRRLPSLWNLDLRLAKTLRLAGNASLALTADVFNVFNAGTALNRQTGADTPVFDRLDTILNPRIIRVGARFQF